MPAANLDLRASDHCCGSAGIYNLKHSEMAQQLLDELYAGGVKAEKIGEVVAGDVGITVS